MQNNDENSANAQQSGSQANNTTATQSSESSSSIAQTPPPSEPLVNNPNPPPQSPEQVVNESISNAQNAAQQAADNAKTVTQEALSKGSDQLQQLGAQGAKELSNAVGQVMQPKMENQPPVGKDEKIYAAISYIPFVALVSIIVKPDSSYVRLHARQGLLLAIIFFFIGIFAAIVSLFGIIGQLLAFVLGLVPIAALIVAMYSMYLSYMGFWWKIPVLGAVAEVIPVEWMAKTSKDNLAGQAGIAKEDYDVRQEALSQEKTEAQAPKPIEPAQPATQDNIPTNNAVQNNTEVTDQPSK